jgi:hypothetical protein
VAGSPPAESSELSDIPSLLRRVAFDRDIDAMATAASEAGEPLTPVMSDVDHFKAVNGILWVMKFCGKSPASCGRALDRKVLPTGIGGQEFAVLLPNYFSSEAIALAERMRRTPRSSTRRTWARLARAPRSCQSTRAEEHHVEQGEPGRPGDPGDASGDSFGGSSLPEGRAFEGPATVATFCAMTSGGSWPPSSRRHPLIIARF